jgi:drug/metabolite transporter (DMT)-like permease
MPARWKVWTALGVVDVVWGSTYLAIAYTVDGLPPLLTAAARFALAAAMLALLVLVRKGTTPFKVSRRAYAGSAVVGVLLLVGGNGGVMLAQDRGLPSGLTALIVAAVPVEVALIRLFYRDRPTRRTLLGVSLGFLGLTVLLLPGTRPAEIAAVVALIPLCGSFLWALGSVIASRISLPRDPLVTTAAQMLGGAVGLGIAGLLRGERGPSEDVPTSAWIAFAYLVVFGAVIAFTAYSWLLSNVPVSKAATYAYVNPVVAVALGAVILDEHISGLSLLGGLITVVAVAVVVTESPRTADQVPVVRQGRLRKSET